MIVQNNISKFYIIILKCFCHLVKFNNHLESFFSDMANSYWRLLVFKTSTVCLEVYGMRL